MEKLSPTAMPMYKRSTHRATRRFLAAGALARRWLLVAFSLSAATVAWPQRLLTVSLPREPVEAPFALVPEQKSAGPKVGLALSGGGLRGIAHIGVLQTLTDHNIPIDFIGATSIGSIIGGLYASGYSPEELWAIVEKLDLGDLLNDSPSRASQFLAEKQMQSRAILQLRLANWKFYLPEAVTPGQKLTNTLTDLYLNAPLHESDFSRLRVPIKIQTTDLLTGSKIVLEQGNLIEAMRASIAVPLLLMPVEYNNSLLVDGGLLDNLPVEETRAMGADVVIAIDCTANLRPREDMNLPWELMDQVTTIMQQEHNLEQLEKADLILSFKSFPAATTQKEVIKTLYETARAQTAAIIPQLKNLLEKKRAEQTLSLNSPSFRFSRVSFSGSTRLGFTDLIDARSSIIYTPADIQANLATLFETGFFSEVAAHIEADGSDTTLIYACTPYPELKQIDLQGNTMLSDIELLTPFVPLLGHPLNRHQARAALQKLIQLYRTEGYSLASLSSVEFDRKSGIARINIDEGRIARVRFEGQEVTKTSVLNRDFALRSGDLFQRKQAQQAINNLYGTGLFNSVTLLPQTSPDGWELIVRLREKKYTVLRLGTHYDLELNGRAFLEVAHENTFGSGNDLILHGQYGDRDHKLSLQFNADRLANSFLSLQVTARQEYAKRFYYKNFNGMGEYERRANGAHISLGMQIARLGMLSGFMRLEKMNIHRLSGSIDDAGELNLNTIGFNSVVDTRDQILFPTRGKYHTFTYEVSSGKFLGADISFFKVQNQLTTFWTFRNRNTLSPRLIWGTSDLTTPFSEQYRIGGEDSFYGLREEEWSGRNIILGSLEYRYCLPWKSYLTFYFSTRFDFGAVWENSVEVNGKDFISGRGAALSLKTPLGPFSAAYGRASNGHDRFYFSAGYNF